jgi:hypothetical protein
MQHFLYSMTSTKQAPAGGGDTESWFRFYKLEAREEVYVPSSRAYDDLKEGDLLWFAMDSVIIGYAPLLRQQRDEINDAWELWFDSSKYVAAPQPFAQVDSWMTTVPELQAQGWLRQISEES